MGCQQIINKRNCMVPTKNNLCHIHIRLVAVVDQEKIDKLKAKIDNQSRELAVINNRLQEAQRKLQIIEYADYVKYRLAPFAIDRSFKAAIRDPTNADEICELFGVDITRCESIYEELLNKRNILTHKYTHQNWIKKKKPPTHGKSVLKLIDSIKTQDLLLEPKIDINTPINLEECIVTEGNLGSRTPINSTPNAWDKPLLTLLQT